MTSKERQLVIIFVLCGIKIALKIRRIKMTSKERQLIIDSVHHWEVDIIDKFYQGFTIETVDQECSINLNWNNGEKVKTGSLYCPLCLQYDDKCEKCLWVRHTQGKECFSYGEEYMVFTCNFNEVTTSKSVVNKLWSIGLQDHSDTHNVDYVYYSLPTISEVSRLRLQLAYSRKRAAARRSLT